MIDEIRSQTLAALEHRMAHCSFREIKTKARSTSRSLAKALTQTRRAMILECKKASPSQGLIRPDFDVAQVVQTYDPFADAISIITNGPFFEGALSFLRDARKHTDKPLLCKDFILAPYQVYEARIHDADAVLLMMNLLSDADFRACFDVATSLHMDVLVEVHDEQELARALLLGAKIIGVNNRDFRTLEVDLSTAERILPKIPEGKITVFESGISSHLQLKQYGKIANAFLVGTSLMKQPDLPRAVRDLLFGRVKVCGLTRDEDAKLAHRLGATWGGLIFANESPRCVTLAEAVSVKLGCGLSFVGVFVNQPAAQIADYAKQLDLKAVQLHGEESAKDISELRPMLPQGVEIWKAIRVKDKIPTPAEFGCDRILLDAFAHDKRGGTGQQFDWSKLKDLQRDAYILSGGLSPKNAREADAQNLWALDVNSGVESAPGIKNDHMMTVFFEELR